MGLKLDIHAHIAQIWALLYPLKSEDALFVLDIKRVCTQVIYHESILIQQ